MRLALIAGELSSDSEYNSFRTNMATWLRSGARSAWVESDGGMIRVYMRKAHHMVDGEMAKTLDIANITVDPPGTGLGMRVINYIHLENPTNTTFVESILNERLAARLAKEGFRSIGNANMVKVK